MRILVTGAAGFIGSAVSVALLRRGDTVVGLDNLSPYYDVALKKASVIAIKMPDSYIEKLLVNQQIIKEVTINVTANH